MTLHRPSQVSQISIQQLVHNDQMLLEQMWRAGDIKLSALTTNHDKWLLCDGASYRQEDYRNLYTVLGGTGGTFNVPNLSALSGMEYFIHA